MRILLTLVAGVAAGCSTPPETVALQERVAELEMRLAEQEAKLPWVLEAVGQSRSSIERAEADWRLRGHHPECPGQCGFRAAGRWIICHNSMDYKVLQRIQCLPPRFRPAQAVGTTECDRRRNASQA